MKFVRNPALFVTASLTVLLALCFPETASANQPPAPQLFSTLVAILPIMALLTLIGGGAAYMKATNKKSRWLSNLVGGAIFIILSAITGGMAFFVTIIFAIWAFVRGAQLVVWGAYSLKKLTEKNPELNLPIKNRLIASGSVLMILSVLAAGMAPAFLNWWPRESSAEETLKEIVAYELVTGKDRLGEDGLPRYKAPTIPEHGHISFEDFELSYSSYVSMFIRPSYKTEFALDPSGKSFKIWITPHGFPFFPYNLLVNLPSFYGDQTGELRMIRVRKDGVKCPENGPVFYKIDKSDMDKVKELIKMPETEEDSSSTAEIKIAPVK